MDLTNEQYERIQSYLDGALAETALAHFLQELETDAAMQEALAFEISLREDLGAMRDKDEMVALQKSLANDPVETAHIRSLIEQAGEGYLQPEKRTQVKPRVATMRTWSYIAAAAILITVTCLIFIYVLPGNNSHDTYSKLYEQYFKKDTVPAAAPPMLAQAFTSYKKNDYAAIQQYDLEHLPNLKGNGYEKQDILELGYYYKGISYMMTGKQDSAGYCLQWVIAKGEKPALIEKANWYLALSLLKAGKKDNALKLLQQLTVTATGDLKQQAAILMERIRNENDK